MKPLTPPEGFETAAGELGIVFDPGDVERLGLFLALMLEENKTHNLTAITDPAEAWTKHILDALALVPLLAAVEPGEGAGKVGGAERVRVIDVGSGGGVPGLPLAIVMPEARFTLLEATGKKADFLRRAVAAIGLKNVSVLAERAERAGQERGEHRERYDAAVIRAVGHLAIVAELATPLVRVGGVVLAVKGAKAEQELAESAKALETLGAAHAQTVPTPTGRIVVLEKIGRTPRAYPRRDGEPKRAPLGVEKRREG